jgi:hypothetical protein
MAELTERNLGYVFGLLGGALFVLGAIVSVVLGAADLLTGRLYGALSAGAEAVILLLVGGLTLFFAYLGHRPWKDRPIVSGVLLVVTAAIGWGVLGLGGNLVALIGAIFAFLAGVLLMVTPLTRRVASFAPA